MKNPTRYWCVVPAAGVGKRMGSDIPKQYLPLGDSTVLQKTLLKLQKIKQLEAVVLCLSSEDEWWAGLSDNYCSDEGQAVIIAAGGKERSDSVLSGLEALAGQASENDWVLVHDVARPCVRVNDIQALIEQASQHEVGGLLAMPVRDTMKRAVVVEGGRDRGEVAVAEVQGTVCRENLWHALTPQMFRYGDLMRAMTDALNVNHPITDEASALERLGKQPLLVEGHPDNIKITHPEDLALAALFLKQQASLK